MIGKAGEALLVRVADRAGLRGQTSRQKGMVDAEAVSAGAEWSNP
jgi:hypothetical protein